MFSNYEELQCSICKVHFMGRRRSEDGDIICPDCLAANGLPLIKDGDDVPDSTHNEIISGGGESGKN